MKFVYLLTVTGICSFFGNNLSIPNQLVRNFQENSVVLKHEEHANLNTALTVLAEGINPKSFNKTWKTEKSIWLEKTNSATDVNALSASMVTLSEQIKPKYFKPAWEKNKTRWIKQVKEARSTLALAGLLKTFSGNLKPEAYTKDWPTAAKQWVEILNTIE